MKDCRATVLAERATVRRVVRKNKQHHLSNYRESLAMVLDDLLDQLWHEWREADRKASARKRRTR